MLPALLLASAGVALARGGGGGNYGGGGDSGGGGGDGDNSWIFEVIWLLFRYPVVGVPVTIVIIVFLVVGAKKGHGAYQGSVIRRGSVALVGNRRADALQTLLERDPAFDEEAFLARVKTAFTKVQEAWCAHDLTPMRPFVSDGIHERFSLQTKEQEDLGYRDRMDDLQILGADLAQVATEGPFDVVTVAVRARARDYRVSVADGKKIRGTDLPEEFVEYWSFQRRRGRATEPGKAGLIEGQCPNCGAAIEMNQWSVCTFCKSVLRSGEFDWVLAEITQAVEWRDTPPAAVPGVTAFRTRDQGFDLTHLQDRVSVMFFRWTMAFRAGGVAPLRKMASPGYAETLGKYLATRAGPGGERRWYGECGVGSVEALAVGAAEGRDRAVVEVRWQGTEFTAKAGGPPVRGDRGLPAQTLFSLARNAGVQSDPGMSVGSAHCPHCGAPELGGESDACEHCGEVLNNGSRDWVLDGVFSRLAPEGQAALAALLPRADGGAEVPEDEAESSAPRRPVRAGCLAWMAQVMLADGEVDEKERAILKSVATKAGMRSADLDALIAAATADGAGNAPRPADPVEAREWLDVMAEVALADGRLDSGERRVLQALGEEAGLSRIDVDLTLARAKARLYQQARVHLRGPEPDGA